jgi:FkbH-like protein
MEPIRLVIWDLDDVFWRGTLSEGGIAYRDEVHDMVIALARRGIMSSICSKNDFAAARDVLRARGIWEYFIFPSIGWEPKGGRIAAIVEAAQLRPETVLFIDDRPANLAEAAHYVPGLQTENHLFIPALLADPRLTGKDDSGLTRLGQYKVLEQRRNAAKTAGDDNLAFLRASGIRVTIDYDVEANLDRAIELINRTNQLNFTKRRLPEEPDAARRALLVWLGRFNVFAGLVRVSDNYGDYGYAGFFGGLGGRGAAHLHYFCFSCRLLDMGVEPFIYRHLGRPALHVSGDVAGNPFKPGEIDWITLADAPGQGAGQPAAKLVDRLVLRGGCDLAGMSHYLAPVAGEIHTEFNTFRQARQYRIDHSMFVGLAFTPPAPPVQAALEAIGYVPADWTSALARPVAPGERTVWLLSFWTDDFIYLYKHKTLNLAVPFLGEGEVLATQDVTFLERDRMRGLMRQDINFAAWEALQRDFWGIGTVFEELLREALGKMLAEAKAAGVMVIFMLTPECWRYTPGAPLAPRPKAAQFNQWLRDAAPEAYFVDALAFAETDAAYQEMLHFDRLVYRRAAAHITALIKAHFTA